MVSYINQFHNTILQNVPVREHSRIKSIIKLLIMVKYTNSNTT